MTNIEPLNGAVASENGHLCFTDDRRDDMYRVAGRGIQVAAQRLDELVPYSGRIDLLKIDVEGYELQVLRGAPEILGRTRCVVFEVTETHFRAFGYNVPTVLKLLAQQGVKLLPPVGQACVMRIGADFVTDNVENLIAVRDVDGFANRSGWTVA